MNFHRPNSLQECEVCWQGADFAAGSDGFERDDDVPHVGRMSGGHDWFVYDGEMSHGRQHPGGLWSQMRRGLAG